MNKLLSIYLTHAGVDTADDLPARIVRNIESFKDSHPGLEHHLFNLETGRDFINKNFGTDVLTTFDSLRPLAYKADLLRYCLLYELGGIYADLSLYFHASALSFDKNAKIFVYRDVISRAPWIISNSLIVTVPKMLVFDSCIQVIINNHKNDYYGVNALCPTGPNLFGSVLAATTDLVELASGEAIRISRSENHSYAYLNSSGDVVAVAVKKGPGLGSLGSAIQENYNDFYNAREIYNHNLIKKTWKYVDLKNRGCVATKDDQGKFPVGIAFYGPYTNLVAGWYRASIFISENDLTLLKENGGYTIDVCAKIGLQLIDTTDKVVVNLGDGLCILSLSFQIFENTDNLEVRIHINQPIDFKIEKLVIERMSDTCG